MDATTIQEIANQLGIAVDKVTDIIPQYAQACIVTDWMIIGFIFGVTILLGLAYLISKVAMPSYSDAPCVIGVIALICLAIFVITLILTIPDIVCWTNWPEARFLSSVIN